jgi:hypothetical protein
MLPADPAVLPVEGGGAAAFFPLRARMTNSTATNTTAIAMTATNISMVPSMPELVG